MTSSSEQIAEKAGYWDNISEYEIDSSWQNNLSEEYIEYRKKFEQAKNQVSSGDFPVSIEITLPSGNEISFL